VRVPRHSSPRRDRATAAAPRPGGRRTGTRRLRALARRAAEPHSMLPTATPQSWHSAPGPRGRRARAVLVSSRSAETLHHRSAGVGIMGAVRTTTCSNFKPQQPSLGDSGGLRAPTLSAPAGSPTGARRATGREPRRPASAGPAFKLQSLGAAKEPRPQDTRRARARTQGGHREVPGAGPADSAPATGPPRFSGSMIRVVAGTGSLSGPECVPRGSETCHWPGQGQAPGARWAVLGRFSALGSFCRAPAGAGPSHGAPKRWG
jgi:hypothetical protein